MEFVAALFAAFPDWRLDHHGPRDGGNLAVAVVTVRMSGTHATPLELPVPGLSPVPPTGKTVTLPSQTYLYTVSNDKIVRILDQPVPHGGIVGVLEQVGVPRLRITRTSLPWTEHSRAAPEPGK